MRKDAKPVYAPVFRQLYSLQHSSPSRRICIEFEDTDKNGLPKLKRSRILEQIWKLIHPSAKKSTVFYRKLYAHTYPSYGDPKGPPICFYLSWSLEAALDRRTSDRIVIISNECSPKEYSPKIPKKTVIKRKFKEMTVPHEGREIVFAYSYFEPKTYEEVGKEILEQDLAVPTGDEIASLLHAAFISEYKDQPEFKSMRRMLGLLVFNRTLWTDKGVYVVKDPEAEGYSKKLKISELEEMLKNGEEINGVIFSKDRKVRFAPIDPYKLGEQTPELSKNGYIIASYGVEGAKKLEEIAVQIATEFGKNPHIRKLFHGPPLSPLFPKSRVSSISFYKELNFDEYYGYGSWHSIGVLR